MPNSLSKFRNVAFDRQAGRCFYCHFLMWRDERDPFPVQHGLSLNAAKQLRCTAEHLSARQDGGRDTAENIVAACWHCNRSRHARTVPLAPNKYATLVASRVARGRWHNRAVVLALAANGNIPLKKARHLLETA